MATELERLHVLIEANTKSYERAMVRLEQKTDRAIRSARKGFGGLDLSLKGIGNAAVGLAARFAAPAAVAALAMKYSQMTDRAMAAAAALSDQADKLGLNVELLQEYRFAADNVGVAQDTFDRRLQGFIRRLGEAQAGGGDLKKITDQYGIALFDASGRARSAEAVMADLADRIAATNNAQEQLRVTTKAFGVDGAGLVNLLKLGSAGMDELRARARELGVVLEEDAVVALAEAQDRIDELNKIVETNDARIAANLAQWKVWASELELFVTDVIGQATDALVKFHAEAAKKPAPAITDGMQIPEGTPMALGAAEVPVPAEWKTTVTPATPTGAGGALPPPSGSRDVVASLREELALIGASNESRMLHNALKQAGVELTSQEGMAIASLVGQISEANAKYEEGQSVFEQTRTETELLAAEQERLNRLLQSGAIDWETYERAGTKASLAVAQAALGALSNMSGALTQVFAKNKAFAIANATINSLEAFTAALRNPPGPPWSYVNAAAALAAGFAQVRAITSTNPGSAGAAPSVAGGVGSSGAAAAAAPIASQQTLFVRGLDAGSLISGEAVRELAGKLIEFQRNGGRVVLA